MFHSKLFQYLCAHPHSHVHTHSHTHIDVWCSLGTLFWLHTFPLPLHSFEPQAFCPFYVLKQWLGFWAYYKAFVCLISVLPSACLSTCPLLLFSVDVCHCCSSCFVDIQTVEHPVYPSSPPCSFVIHLFICQLVAPPLLCLSSSSPPYSSRSC